MSTRHTPGPWEITSISQNTGNIGVGRKDLRILIAEVTNAASFEDMLAGAMRRGGGEFRQSDAHTQFSNARLIAAAPELLEIAQMVDAWGHGLRHLTAHEAKMVKAARAAIAKAVSS